MIVSHTQGRHGGLPLHYIRNIFNYCRERIFSFHICRSTVPVEQKLISILVLSSILLSGCCGVQFPDDSYSKASPSQSSVKKELLLKILEEHKLWLKSNGKQGKRANLVNEYLCKANLRGAILDRAYLSRANFYGANLHGASFKYADLKYANLKYSNLQDANFRNADLSGASLQGADLTWADLSWARLDGADFSGANLTYANLQYARTDGTNFTGANMEKATLK